MKILSAFACLALAHESAGQQDWRPTVIMHGMNNNEKGYTKLQDSLEATYPGVYVVALSTYDDFSSMTTHMDKQLAAMVSAIQADPKLAGGFNFYGESQGALLARAYVSSVNNPPVHNLVALNGPQAGVGECPTIEIPVVKQLCGDLGSTLDIYHWPARPPTPALRHTTPPLPSARSTRRVPGTPSDGDFAQL